MNVLVAKKKKEKQDTEKILDEIIKERSRDAVLTAMKDYQIGRDALWLLFMMNRLEMSPEDIKEFYIEFYKDVREQKEFYEEEFDGVIQNNAIKELSENGIDMVEMAEKYSEPLVLATFSE